MKNIVILGSRSSYWLGLMEYINNQGEVQAYLCTDTSSLLKLMEEKMPEILFCEERYSQDQWEALPVVLFLEDKTAGEGIYLYQPADRLYEEMCRYIFKGKYRTVSASQGDKLYAVCSPIGRSGKTSFACAYAKEHSFFYLGLEEYGLIGNNRAGSEGLLYHIKVRRPDITACLKKAVEEWEGLRVIASPGDCSDLRFMTGEDISWFLDRIRKDVDFPAVIVDIGTGCLIDLEILDSFDRVYVPVIEEPFARQKMERFRELLYEVNGRMKDKIVTIWVPDLFWKEEGFLEQVQYKRGLDF